RLEIDDERGDLDACIVDQDVVATQRGDGGCDRLCHCASSVTFSSTKPVLAPVFARRPAVSLPRSARMSPIITEAPAFVSASAIAAPMPRAPPVTRALRPASLFSLIAYPPLVISLL